MNFRSLLLLGLLIMTVSLGSASTLDQGEMSMATFDEFQSFDLQDLRTLQVKLTFVGTQEKPVPSVVFTSFYNVLDLERFKPFRRSGIHYGNDDLAVVLNFTTTPGELRRMIDSLGEIPAVRTGEVVGGFLSFMMHNLTERGEKAFEAILDLENAELFLTTIRSSMDPSNGMALHVLDSLVGILF